jgi:uncharacterized protein YbjT (DUF2867 family)
MTKPHMLVTGSTGKTGAPVVELLLARGYPVRGLAHRVDDRSQHLAVLGAEVVVGDFRDLPSLRAAMQGVKRVYFCYPPQVIAYWRRRPTWPSPPGMRGSRPS